jgi:hypothetical protein
MISKKSLFIVFSLIFISPSVNLGIINNPSDYNNNDIVLLKNNAPYNAVDYLIITVEDFKSVIEPLANWKTQKGLVAKIILISEINQQYSGRNNAEKIKNCIIDYYTTYDTKWVLLAGDQDHVTTQYALCLDGFPFDGNVVSCDSYYADLDNDWDLNNDGSWGTSSDEFDYEAEVFVGRLPADDELQMELLVQRTIYYEKKPTIGSWMTNALFAGTILQFDQDWNNDSIVDYGECDGNRVNNFIDGLLPDNWTSTFLAQTQGVKGSSNYSDYQLNYNTLKYFVQEGCSIGTIYAHGSPQGMAIDRWLTDYDGDMLFDYTADPFEGGGTSVDELLRDTLISTDYMYITPEENKTGIFYFGSCSTGTFDDENECLAEKFLRRAAIGVLAASNVAWGEDQWYERDHGGWFVEGLGFRFYEQLFQNNQPGKALALAKADYVLDRSVSAEPNDYPEWEDKTLKQYNLLGDPEIPIWLSVPKQLNISYVYPTNNNESIITLEITAEGIPVPNATITYTKDTNLFWKGTTNENGTIDIPLSEVDIKGKLLTTSKNGYVPYQISIPQVDSESIPGYDIFITLTIVICFICIYLVSSKQIKRRKF